MADTPPAPGWWKDAAGGWHPPTDEPRAKANPKPSNKNTGIGCGVVIALALLIGACIALVGGDSSTTNGPSDGGAIDVCEQRVSGQLKAPSTADYSDEKVTHSGNDYTVVGAVDSDNSFGAKIRGHFVCTATYISGTTWNPVSAQVLEA